MNRAVMQVTVPAAPFELVVGDNQRVRRKRRITMLRMIKILLSAAFVLGIVFDASAATRHHQAVHAARSADGVPVPYNGCNPAPLPCRTPRNDW